MLTGTIVLESMTLGRSYPAFWFLQWRKEGGTLSLLFPSFYISCAIRPFLPMFVPSCSRSVSASVSLLSLLSRSKASTEPRNTRQRILAHPSASTLSRVME